MRPAARRGTSVIGDIAVERHLDDGGYIDFLAVTAAERGTGTGAVPVVAAMEWCRDQACTGLHPTVREDNGAARALYGRLGFTAVVIAVPWRIGTTMTDR